ncbi:MAG: type II secretion system protein GspJ [Gammaproteobacteria bacterium]|nr:MAG: type II secretion system protein GspJ [Gammaproteobacteria bacterium]PIE37800.1 MAG: type II secretion system protein GspJ [Gammaproteobacteria bacterium]
MSGNAIRPLAAIPHRGTCSSGSAPAGVGAKTGNRQTGFTLVELLVAMFLLAILGTASFQMLMQINRARDVVLAQSERLSELQRTFYWLAEDITQISKRRVRSAIDSELLPFQQNIEGENLFELTRSGWANPAADIAPARSTLQRVAWGLDGDRLMRMYWYHLETTSEEPTRRRRMLRGVKSLSLRFIDREGSWQESWPPPNLENPGMPRAIEFTFELDDMGEVRRVFALPD